MDRTTSIALSWQPSPYEQTRWRMKPVRILPLLCSLGLLAQGAAAASDQRAHDLPAREGLCVRSTISAIGERLVDGTNDQPIPGSGSSVDFADGLNQVGYD